MRLLVVIGHAEMLTDEMVAAGHFCVISTWPWL